jgi:hypothetical protein
LLLREVESCVRRRASFALETTLAGRGYLKDAHYRQLTQEAEL